MKNQKSYRYKTLFSILVILVLSMLACTIDMGETTQEQDPQQGQNQPLNDNDQETEIALQELELAIQQTQLAQTQTAMAIQPTTAPATDTPAPQPTTEPPTQEPPTAEPPTIEPPTPEPSYPDFDTWAYSANILLYEDMAGDFGTTRFVKEALDDLGLDYMDVKDASGDFKNALLSGTDWDLIIAASELRTGVTGEFFEYYSDAVRDGSSLILEVWNMDSFANGKIQLLLNQCGVEYQADYWEPSQAEKLLTIHAPDHPVVNIIWDDIRMTSLLDYWWWWPDMGDLMQLTYSGDAVIVLGARTNVDDAYGTVVSCIDDRFVLQTHSTHTYSKDRVVPLWQNYIASTLVARYLYLYPDADVDF